MTFSFPRFGLILTSILWLAVPEGWAGFRFDSGPGDQHRFSITYPFDGIPARGFLPVRIEITNRTEQSGNWIFRSEGRGNYARHGSYGYALEEPLTVPAGETRVFEFLCPIVSANVFQRRYIPMSLSGSGTDRGWSEANGLSGNGPPVFGAWTPSLNRLLGGSLSYHFETEGYQLLDGSGTMNYYPSDARAYEGVDLFWLRQEDWEGFPSETQAALLDWVAQGGELRMLRESSRPAMSAIAALPGPNQPTRGYGVGTIRVYPPMSSTDLFSRKGRGTDPEDIPDVPFWSPVTSSAKGNLPPLVYDENTSAVPLQDIYKPVGVNLPLIIGGMIAFAIVVGPLNLWYFSRGKRRMRLLVSTPLISIFFSLGISASILVSDGVGGEGTVARLLLLLPDRNREVLFQTEQARTGLLLDTSFTMEEPFAVRSLGSRVSEFGNFALDGDYQRTGDLYQGSWYGSRRLQGVAWHGIRPSRSGFEVAEDAEGNARITSTLPGTCSELYYFAGGREVYRATNVRPGESVRLEPAQWNEFQKWLSSVRIQLGEDVDRKLRGVRMDPGKVFARIRLDEGVFPETLPSLDWKVHESLVVGPATQGERGEAGQ